MLQFPEMAWMRHPLYGVWFMANWWKTLKILSLRCEKDSNIHSSMWRAEDSENKIKNPAYSENFRFTVRPGFSLRPKTG
jgi:hypothetical protein